MLLLGSATAAIAAEVGLLADLPPDEREALDASLADTPLPDDPAGLLERVLLLAPAYRFDVGLLGVDTDRRWFSAQPRPGPGSAILELRRWPGDTVISLYVLRGAVPPDGHVPPIASATLEGPVVKEGLWWWEGTLDTRSGARRALWIERAVEGGAGRLGVLVVPGDAGLGEVSARYREIEARFVVGRLVFREEAWVEIGQEAVAGEVAVPELGLAPRKWDERDDTWQIARGFGFTLGVPPGVHAMRLASSFTGPTPIEGATLWFRGRFADATGEPVVVGDGIRAGYVVEVPGPPPEWVEGKTAPAAAPTATPKAGTEFELATERTGAGAARAERWTEPGFDGSWLVFRLVFADRGVEIDIPVLSGRQSEALYWIPVSWRPDTLPPAPPPVDAAARFGIRWAPLTKAAKSHQPWTEGYLTTPGLRLELPKDWWPVVTLRSENGFPVRIIDLEGKTKGWVVRVDAGDPMLEPAADSGWAPIGRPKRYQAVRAYSREDGARLYVAREGHGFEIRPEPGSEVEVTQWAILVDSASLRRP